MFSDRQLWNGPRYRHSTIIKRCCKYKVWSLLHTMTTKGNCGLQLAEKRTVVRTYPTSHIQIDSVLYLQLVVVRRRGTCLVWMLLSSAPRPTLTVQLLRRKQRPPRSSLDRMQISWTWMNSSFDLRHPVSENCTYCNYDARFKNIFVLYCTTLMIWSMFWHCEICQCC